MEEVMKGYKIYEQLKWGEVSSETKYSINYDKSIQVFNDFLREAINDNALDLVDKECFGQEVLSFRERLEFYKREDVEIICRKRPFIIYRHKDTNKLVANVYFWERTSYEYQEYDIETQTIVLEEIEIIE